MFGLLLLPKAFWGEFCIEKGIQLPDKSLEPLKLRFECIQYVAGDKWRPLPTSTTTWGSHHRMNHWQLRIHFDLHRVGVSSRTLRPFSCVTACPHERVRRWVPTRCDCLHFHFQLQLQFCFFFSFLVTLLQVLHQDSNHHIHQDKLGCQHKRDEVDRRDDGVVTGRFLIAVPQSVLGGNRGKWRGNGCGWELLIGIGSLCHSDSNFKPIWPEPMWKMVNECPPGWSVSIEF